MVTFIFLERTCVVSSTFSEGLVTKRTPPRTAVWDQLMRGVYGKGCGLMDLEAENTGGGCGPGSARQPLRCECRVWGSGRPCCRFGEAAVGQALGR